MRCTNCNTENPPGKKFCGDCGAALANPCPKCGADNPAGKRFCGECGTALGAPAAAASAKKSNDSLIRVADALAAENLEGERKTVTALFADIKGSTELEQDLDPEEARAIIDPALKLMIEAVHRYDGYIVQSTGDGIFALFGAPVAHEDHPQRALYSALRTQDELKRYSAKLVADGGSPLQCRVGINTGEVVVRSITTGAGQTEYTPIGHTTNLASRMQAVAPVGSIAVAEPTRKLVEGYFALKALGPTKLKGVSEPVNVYEVTGLGPLRTRLQRSAGRGLSKFVGREREMAAMEAAAERAKSGHGQIVAAMAEAGTGKSRLFYEFKVKNQSGWMVLETFSVSHGKASAYLPLIELLWNYFKINSDDDDRARREKVTGRVLALERTLEDTLPYLFALLAIVEGEDPLAQMDPQVRKRRTLDSIKRMLLRESLNQPLMVIFEDLHWIDDETQALLNLLADSIPNSKILMLVNYRPEYSHQWNSKTYYSQLRLDPLGKENADEMLSAMVGDSAEIRPLKLLIIERTQGNPFFMEETVQVLLDEGALVREGAVARLTKPLGELKIPPTVQAILAARIDRLSKAEKELLQTLAVLGKEFQLSLIRAVMGQSDDDLNRMLSELQLAEFIYEQPAVGDVEYTFKHALTQEVAYNSILAERRKQLHERIGAAIETLYAASLDDHLNELAHHYVRSANARKALEYLMLAGERALARSAHLESSDHFESALKLLHGFPEDTDLKLKELRIVLNLVQSLNFLHGPATDRVEPLRKRMLVLCDQVGDSRQRIWAYNLERVSRTLSQDYKGALEIAERILEIGAREDDAAAIQTGHFSFGQTLQVTGDFINARRHFEEGWKVFSERSDARFHAALDGTVVYPASLAVVVWCLGYPDRALALARQALTASSASAHDFSVVLATLMTCGVYRQVGDAARHREIAARGLELAESGGFELITRNLRLEQRWARSEIASPDHELDDKAILLAVGSLLAPGNLVAALVERSGKVREGLALLQPVLETMARTGGLGDEAEIRRVRGELLSKSAPANANEAEQSLRAAIDVARGQAAKSFELRATTSLARLLDKQGRRNEARATLADVYNWFTEGFDTADLKDAKALLSELNA
ncbi:MAG TPA: adenylate/guanylate cyclase domain-containing protein [Candidatus Acidoferrales bacterium]|nr:adenylate/guanylate cyclase domain-containing protein [Candidatus Acidoferrales bacterium]